MTSTDTPDDFNTLVRGFSKTTSPYPLRITSTGSYMEEVFIELFGQTFVTNIHNGKLLTNKNTLVFEDSPTSAVGIKVKGFVLSQWDALTADIEALQKDTTLKLNAREAQTVVLKLIIERKAKSRTILITQLAQDEAAIQSIIDMYSFDDPQGSESFLRRVRNYLAAIDKAKVKGALKTVVEVKDELNEKVGSALSILAWGGIYQVASQLWGKIPVLLGPCPLKHAHYIEIARSGKILKFRATGSVFLAAQEGGDDAIKIEGTLYKAEYAIMFILWGLFLYGQAKFRDMKTIPGFDLGGASATTIRKLNDLITTNTDLERPTYEFHQTFPFVNKHFIIPNCYIETISIEDKLPLKDTLRYTILLRTYEKPTEVTWLEDKKSGSRISGFKNKTLTSKICEYSLNAGWRMLNYSGWLIDDQEWKIGSARDEGVTDTYYDVDWASVASVVYLNMVGAVT